MSADTWLTLGCHVVIRGNLSTRSLIVNPLIVDMLTLAMTCHDAEVYYDTTTGASAHYSQNTFALSTQIEVFGKQIAYTSQNLQHQPRPRHPNTVYYAYSDESDEDEPLKANKSDIDPLIRESTDRFLMGDEETKINSHEDIDNLVQIPRSNLSFDIQNEESDESETKTITEEVQINSSQNTAQIPPSYGKLTFDLTMPKPILTFSHFHLGYENKVFDHGRIVIDVDSNFKRSSTEDLTVPPY
uniref:Uncharacterized protein n=1 Tax=Tanacetum cinerariifolium TaxID=118510 RepID=A0A6L2P4Q0_TANCI|nr:hypothetical protein [Tanacetum cinerariifolium]